MFRGRDGRESVERGVVGVLCVQETRWKGVGGEGGGWSVVCAGAEMEGSRRRGVDWIVVCSGAEMEGSRWRGGWLECFVCRSRDRRESVERGVVVLLCVQETRWVESMERGVVGVL